MFLEDSAPSSNPGSQLASSLKQSDKKHNPAAINRGYLDDLWVDVQNLLFVMDYGRMYRSSFCN